MVVRFCVKREAERPGGPPPFLSNVAGLLQPKGTCTGPPLKGSEVWALGLHRVYTGACKGFPFKGPIRRDHATTIGA